MKTSIYPTTIALLVLLTSCADRKAESEKARQEAEAKARAEAARKEAEALPKAFSTPDYFEKNEPKSTTPKKEDGAKTQNP